MKTKQRLYPSNSLMFFIFLGISTLLSLSFSVKEKSDYKILSDTAPALFEGNTYCNDGKLFISFDLCGHPDSSYQIVNLGNGQLTDLSSIGALNFNLFDLTEGSSWDIQIQDSAGAMLASASGMAGLCADAQLVYCGIKTLVDGENIVLGNIHIEDNYAIWVQSSGASLDIFAYDFTNPTQGILNLSSSYSIRDILPQISGNYVVWITDSGSRDIMLYDLSNPGQGAIIISEQNNYNYFPQISGNYVVWEVLKTGGSEIYYYDISNPSQGYVNVTNSYNSSENLPLISGSYIVWQSYSNGFIEISGFDLANPTAGVSSIFTTPTYNGSQIEMKLLVPTY